MKPNWKDVLIVDPNWKGAYLGLPRGFLRVWTTGAGYASQMVYDNSTGPYLGLAAQDLEEAKTEALRKHRVRLPSE